jgi:hypothetical protein
MDPLIVAVSITVGVTTVLAAFAAVIVARSRSGRALTGIADPAAFAALSEALGLRAEGSIARGRLEDLDAELQLVERPSASPHRRTRLVAWTVLTLGTDIHDLQLGRERRMAGGGGDVKTGDPAFDHTVWAEGDAARVSALLDAPTRRLVLDLTDEATHDDGRWVWAREGTVTDAAGVRERVVAMATIARRWRDLDTPAALLEHAVTDPVPGVRERAAERLVAWWERNPRDLTPEAAELLASTPTFRGVEVRLARLRGAAGRAVLRKWASGEGDAAVEAALGLAELHDPEAEAVLLAHLKTRDPRVIAALGSVGGAAAADALEVLLTQASAWGGQPEPLQRALAHLRARVPKHAPPAT